MRLPTAFLTIDRDRTSALGITPEAIENAADIAQVEGVDVLFIGTSDLTASMGISGQMGHQKVIDAYQAVGEACRRHGTPLGQLVASAEAGASMSIHGELACVSCGAAPSPTPPSARYGCTMRSGEYALMVGAAAGVVKTWDRSAPVWVGCAAVL